eukprot:29107-Pelagococcus_subviridis.AAC.3
MPRVAAVAGVVFFSTPSQRREAYRAVRLRTIARRSLHRGPIHAVVARRRVLRGFLTRGVFKRERQLHVGVQLRVVPVPVVVVSCNFVAVAAVEKVRRRDVRLALPRRDRLEQLLRVSPDVSHRADVLPHDVAHFVREPRPLRDRIARRDRRAHPRVPSHAPAPPPRGLDLDRRAATPGRRAVANAPLFVRARAADGTTPMVRRRRIAGEPLERFETPLVEDVRARQQHLTRAAERGEAYRARRLALRILRAFLRRRVRASPLRLRQRRRRRGDESRALREGRATAPTRHRLRRARVVLVVRPRLRGGGVSRRAPSVVAPDGGGGGARRVRVRVLATGAGGKTSRRRRDV